MREEGLSMAEEVEWFVGIDWASQSHQVCLVDVRGECLGERAIAHGGLGIEELCDWLIARTGATPEVIGVAIEMTARERALSLGAPRNPARRYQPPPLCRAAPARPQPRPRPAHRRRPLAVGGLHPARTADAVRPQLRGSRRRRRVSIRLPSLCSIESRHPFIPTCLLAERRAQRQSRMPPRLRRHRRNRRKASLTERARCYPLPWRHCITGVARGYRPALFRLIIGGRSLSSTGESWLLAERWVTSSGRRKDISAWSVHGCSTLPDRLN